MDTDRRSLASAELIADLTSDAEATSPRTLNLLLAEKGTRWLLSGSSKPGLTSLYSDNTEGEMTSKMSC
ncbi:hypothetical protein ACOMHN_015027 [Nucella lapillus]